MNKEKLTIIKVGGKIVEEDESLTQLLADFKQIEGHKLLVHGGGRLATQLANEMGVESKMIDGRRITDAETLRIVVMVYGGLVNKTIVARLQAAGVNALGLTGADLHIIRSEKRPVREIDYGFAGDVKEVNGEALAMLINQSIVPVLAPLTYDNSGNMLNTNADTIAAETAKALARFFDVTLTFCFEKKGVLMNPDDEDSVIRSLNKADYQAYKEKGIIQGGMLPKLDNAFDAIEKGVKEVIITKAAEILNSKGTVIQ